VPLDGFNIRKSDLEKRKNDDEVEEGWVACDQCEGWVHQICGLFNKGRNDQSRGFLCPFCLRDGEAARGRLRSRAPVRCSAGCALLASGR
jgi:E1A/CREB-binding protein